MPILFKICKEIDEEVNKNKNRKYQDLKRLCVIKVAIQIK